MRARQRDQFGGGDAQRAGDAVQPVDRYGSGAGFQTADGLGRGGRDAQGADLFQRQPLGLAYLPDAGDHAMSCFTYLVLVLSYKRAAMASPLASDSCKEKQIGRAHV